MGYYMGDFYRGYRGDPGFFSFLGGLAKKAVGFIPGVGPIAKTAIDVVGKVAGGRASKTTNAKVKRGGGAGFPPPRLWGGGGAGGGGGGRGWGGRARSDARRGCARAPQW